MSRESYNIAIVGSSGRGKTYSLRNLDPETTGFINIAAKPLPFKNNFKHYCMPKDWSEAYNKLVEYAKNDDIKIVVLEDFSEYMDSVLKTAREIKKGYDIWNYYNQKIGELNYIIKRYPKDIIVTAHTDKVEIDGGITEERMFVKGKEWKGDVEKDYTIVLYADTKISDNQTRDYYFRLNTDGVINAKTPPDLFEGQETIPNDAGKVLEEIDKVFGQ